MKIGPGYTLYRFSYRYSLSELMLIKSNIITLKKIMKKIVVEIKEIKANLRMFFIRLTASEIPHKIKRNFHFSLHIED